MNVTFGGESHEIPSGAVIGCVGAAGSGVDRLLHSCSAAAADLVAMEYTIDRQDAVSRLRTEAEVYDLQRAGRTVVIASHDCSVLQRLADEIWWVDGSRIRQKGDPGVVLRAYAKDAATRFRAAAGPGALSPAMRRGDGRAQIIGLETLDSTGRLTGVWTSGEPAVIRATVHFAQAVENPVVGIMIRTRIGMEVYGTNTELEGVKVGPCSAGDTRVVTFRFACDLCPQHYAITAASHDPDGVWHDWVEDAVAFTVADSRYTAGVANLRASVTCTPE